VEVYTCEQVMLEITSRRALALTYKPTISENVYSFHFRHLSPRDTDLS
jgi:hypothetical protein